MIIAILAGCEPVAVGVGSANRSVAVVLVGVLAVRLGGAWVESGIGIVTVVVQSNGAG